MQRYLMPFINNYPSEGICSWCGAEAVPGVWHCTVLTHSTVLVNLAAALARRNHASVDRIMKKIASRFLGGVMEPMRVGDMCIILGMGREIFCFVTFACLAFAGVHLPVSQRLTCVLRVAQRTGAFAEPGAEPPADRLEAWLRVVSKRLDMDAASNSDLVCVFSV